MRTLFSAAALAAVLSPGLLSMASSPEIVVSDVTVGRNLEAAAHVRLSQTAPEDVKLTITSDDPARALLSLRPDEKGSASVSVSIRAQLHDFPEFWVHGLTDSGAATYTVTAPGLTPAKGSVQFTPSAFVILGPFRLPSFPTTPRGVPSRLTIVAAAVDSSSNIIEQQFVAGGREIEVKISNSNPAAGRLSSDSVIVAGGSSEAGASFTPAAEGRTTIAPLPPPGFAKAAEYASVLASVEPPGLAISDKMYLGKDLQVGGVLCLGEPAPPGGLKVTLTSGDPSAMVISDKADQLGAGSLTLTVPEGQLTAEYVLQGLGDHGAVTYKATAESFRSRTAKVELTPSGFIIAFDKYGPPDEAAVLRGGAAAHEERRFFASVSGAKDKPIGIMAYAVHLDSATGFAADITVQSLRAGVNATLVLESSNPAVGTIESPLKLEAGATRAATPFHALAKGETVISLKTPEGFSTPKNATSVPATITD